MAVTAHKLGPGQLTFGETASEREFGLACPEVEIVPTSEDGEKIVVLSGDELEDNPDDGFELKGKVFQQYSMDSLIVWTKEHAGEEMPFRYIPANDGSLQITGTVRIKPVRIGGEVRKRNTSDFTFPGVGDWTPAAWTASP